MLEQLGIALAAEGRVIAINKQRIEFMFGI